MLASAGAAATAQDGRLFNPRDVAVLENDNRDQWQKPDKVVEALGLQPGSVVADIGTGSGILMAAAAQLGARRLSGVDTDAVAVETARGNLELNRVDPAAYDLHIGNLTRGLARQYTLATANIITPVILQLLDLIGNDPSRDAAPVLVPGGRLIVSGILVENRAQVAEKMQQAGFDVIESRDRDGWTALAGVLADGGQ